MDYEIFKAMVVEKFKDYLPEEFSNHEVRCISVEKINSTMDAITLVDLTKDRNISPTSYVQDMYANYQNGYSFEEIMQRSAATMVKAFEDAPMHNSNIDPETAKERIVFQLINTEQNKDLLKSVPHREFKDLSIVYRWVMDKDENGISSAVIHTSLAEKIGLSEEDLYALAAKNTKEVMPSMVAPMEEVLRGMLSRDNLPDEVIDDILREAGPKIDLWVIGNKFGVNGASAMLYEENLHKIAEEIGDDLYILPSSVHEVLAVSAKGNDPEILAGMVNEVNMSQVDLVDRLSNQVYFYDKQHRKLSLATDTPLKRLDGKDQDKVEKRADLVL